MRWRESAPFGAAGAGEISGRGLIDGCTAGDPVIAAARPGLDEAEWRLAALER